MQVKNLMTQPPQTCPVTMRLAAVSRRMRETGCGTVVALNQGRLVGIVTDRDLALAVGCTDDPARVQLETVMTRRVHTASPDDDLRVALENMARHKVRRLPVVSQDGEVLGLISIDDIILWGVQESGVTVHDAVAALRSICATYNAVVEETSAR